MTVGARAVALRMMLPLFVHFGAAPLIAAEPSPQPQATPQPTPQATPQPLPTQSPTTAPVKRTVKKSKIDSGWTAFFGLLAGRFTEGKPKAPEGLEPHAGSILGGSLIASQVRKFHVLDLGLDWRYSRISGVEPSAEDPLEEVNAVVATQSAVLSAAARYRVARAFEVGAGLEQWVANDLSFSAFENEPKFATFIAAQMVASLVRPTRVIRAKLTIETDVSIPDRQITLYGLAVEFGLPIIGRTNLYIEEQRKKTEVVKEVVTKEKIEEVKVNIEVVRILLQPASLNFTAGTAEQTRTGTEYVTELAKAIGTVSDKFKTLLIRVILPSGQEDLAKARAAKLQALILRSGLAKERVLAADKTTVATQIPKTGMIVELNFAYATDKAAIENALQPVQVRFSTPETCLDPNSGACK